MKYSASEVNAMSWQEWCETMADELNKAGYKRRGRDPETGQWVDNIASYEAGDPRSFILGEVEGAEEIEYLKSLGLLNNGRCPMCGKPIYGHPGRFTNGFNPDMHFQICQDCVNQGRRTQQALGLAPRNSGCLVGLLLLPLNVIAGMVKMIFG